MTAHHPRVGIIVTDVYAPDDPDHDTPLLVAALRARDIDAEALVWHDEQIDLTAFDLVVVRSPWDYPERPADFHAWLDHAETATRVWNTPAIMRWNLDKHYLRDLEEAGARIVLTRYCRSAADVRDAFAEFGPGRIVVKPAVSAGARDTGLFDVDDERALRLADRLVAAGRVVMVQPEIPELSAGAEKALYAIGGRYTHAISKGALLDVGGGFLGGVYIEHPELTTATEAERAFAADVMRAVERVTDEPTPLYARVDIVDSAEFGLLLLEVELVEPALNLHVAPDVIDTVVDAVVAALEPVPAAD